MTSESNTQTTPDELGALTLADELAALEAAEERRVAERASELGELIERGARAQARAYASKFARGLGSLSRAERVFGALRRGDDDVARWARARLEVVAFVSALRDPDEAKETQNELCLVQSKAKVIVQSGGKPRGPLPRIGLLVRSLVRIKAILPALREEVARRIQVRAVIVRRVLESRADEHPEEHNPQEPPLPDPWEARLLLNTLLAREKCPSLPALDFDLERNSAPEAEQEPWKTDYDRESEELSNDLVTRAGIRNAAQALRYFGLDRRATEQLADWAGREGLLSGLSAPRFTQSLYQVIEAIAAVVRSLEDIAALEGRTDLTKNNTAALLEWAIREELIDDIAAQEIARAPSGAAS